MDHRLDDPDPRIRDLAYLLFLEELLGGKWVERWAREREARCAAGVAEGGADPGFPGAPRLIEYPYAGSYFPSHAEVGRCVE